MVCALPASATGGRGAAFTVMITFAVELLRWYPLPLIQTDIPLALRPLTVVETEVGVAIFSPDGPDSLFHSLKILIFPAGSHRITSINAILLTGGVYRLIITCIGNGSTGAALT